MNFEFMTIAKNETCCGNAPQQVSLCSGSVVLFQLVDHRVYEFQLLLHRAGQPLYDLLDMIRMEFRQFLFQFRFALRRTG